MSSTAILQVFLAVIITYGMHSTLLLMLAWCIDLSRPIKSLALQERLWKSAVMIPLLTTAIQLSWTDAKPLWEWQLEADTTTEILTAAMPEPPPISELPVTNPDLAMETISSAARENVSPKQNPPSVPHEVSASPFTKAWPLNDGAIFEEGRASGTGLPPKPVSQAVAGRVHEPVAQQSENSEFEVLVTTAIQRKRQQEASVVSLRKWSAILLVTGAVWGTLRFLFCTLQLQYQLRQGKILTDGHACELLRGLCMSRQIQHEPRLLLSAHCGEPAAVGLFRPTIVLPVGLELHLDSVELRALLAHELAHLVRRDTVWMWIGHVIRYSIAWQPLNLLAVNRWRMIAEFQCDQWATGTDEAGRVTLAKVLAGIAEWKSAGMIGFAASAAGPPLSQRITRLLSRQVPADRWEAGWRRYVSRSMVIVAVVLTSFFGPRLVQIESAAAVAPLETVAEEPLGQAAESVEPSVSQESVSEVALLRDEFNALASDLGLALELLTEQEDDKEVTQQTAAIAEKLERLRMRIESTETD